MTLRELPPSSPFAADDGSADPAVAAALAAFGAGSGALADVVAALHGSRVLVPVMAELDVAGTHEHDGVAHRVDKEATTGVVALRAPDGRTALPVFTCVASVSAWRSQARPVPSDAARAALSAVQEGWELVVVDPGGPVTALLPRPAVWALAQQVAWEPAVVGVGDRRHVVDVVRDAVIAAVGGVPGVVQVDAVPGGRAEVAVVLGLVPGLGRGDLDVVLSQVNAALVGSQVVADRVDSLELRLRGA
ncbi:SseB family protein [Cellulomonas soli]